MLARPFASPRSWARALAAPLLVVGLAAASCAGDRGGEPDASELGWGIGGAADGSGCDPSAELCWTPADGATMRRYMAAQQDLLLGEGEPKGAARALVSALFALSHKLEPGERRAVDALRDRVESLPEEPTDEERLDLVQAAHEAAGERLLSGYLTAYAVPVGQEALEALEGDGPADSFGEAGDELPETAVTEGMRESLDLLRASGPLGLVYAFMLEHTGVLEDLPPPLEESFPYDEPLEDRADRIVRRAGWATAGWSTVAAAESLIPYAGTVISISHEALMHFRLRARMVFEIAAVYGLDLRQDLNLLLATTALMTSYHLPEMQGIWVSSMALPVLAAAVERLGGAASVRAAVRAALFRAVQAMLASVSARGAEIAGGLAARAAARGAGRTILGYATFGVALLGDVALSTMGTAAIGEHADVMLRPWGAGMLVEAAATMADPEARDCAALLLGQEIWADGTASDEELGLLAAHLGRDAFVDGRFVEPASPDEIDALALRAAAVGGRDPGAVSREVSRCVDRSFVGIEARDRLATLEWALTMAAVDGRLDTAELASFDALVDALDGSDWLGDGDEIPEAHIEVMEGRVLSLFLDEARDPGLEDVRPGALIERHDELSARAADAVAAAFAD